MSRRPTGLYFLLDSCLSLVWNLGQANEKRELFLFPFPLILSLHPLSFHPSSSSFLFFPSILRRVSHFSEQEDDKDKTVERLKNYPFLYTTISREPEVVARRVKKHFKGEGLALLTVFHLSTGSRYLRNYSESKFF